MTLVRMQDDFVPIGEFSTHASRIIRGLRETGRPVVITQHGRPAAVLISPEVYDQFVELDLLLGGDFEPSDVS